MRNLEAVIKYKFKNIALLKEAISHPSLKQCNISSKHYEKLEFLGDAVLNFVITDIIFQQFKNAKEGLLAKIRAYLVSKNILVKVGRDIKLDNVILLSDSEESCGGRNNINNIENAMEALIAAIYLDSDIANTRAIVSNLWAHYITDKLSIEIDPKSALQELCQKYDHINPCYTLISQKGSMHEPMFEVEVRINNNTAIGMGTSKKLAEKDAALKYLRMNFNLEVL